MRGTRVDLDLRRHVRGGNAGNLVDAAKSIELKMWAQALKAYRAQQWDSCDVQLLNLQRLNAKKYLYQLYAERVASMRLLPFDPEWDGATNFQTK